jgi:hypothetical protein
LFFDDDDAAWWSTFRILVWRENATKLIWTGKRADGLSTDPNRIRLFLGTIFLLKISHTTYNYLLYLTINSWQQQPHHITLSHHLPKDWSIQSLE